MSDPPKSFPQTQGFGSHGMDRSKINQIRGPLPSFRGPPPGPLKGPPPYPGIQGNQRYRFPPPNTKGNHSSSLVNGHPSEILGEAGNHSNISSRHNSPVLNSGHQSQTNSGNNSNRQSPIKENLHTDSRNIVHAASIDSFYANDGNNVGLNHNTNARNSGDGSANLGPQGLTSSFSKSDSNIVNSVQNPSNSCPLPHQEQINTGILFQKDGEKFTGSERNLVNENPFTTYNNMPAVPNSSVSNADILKFSKSGSAENLKEKVPHIASESEDVNASKQVTLKSGSEGNLQNNESNSVKSNMNSYFSYTGATDRSEKIEAKQILDMKIINSPLQPQSFNITHDEHENISTSLSSYSQPQADTIFNKHSNSVVSSTFSGIPHKSEKAENQSVDHIHTTSIETSVLPSAGLPSAGNLPSSMGSPAFMKPIVSASTGPPTNIGPTPTFMRPPPTSMGHTPTNIGPPPTSMGHTPTNIGPPPTSMGHTPTNIGPPPTSMRPPSAPMGSIQTTMAPPSTFMGHPPTSMGPPPTSMGPPLTPMGPTPTTMGLPPTSMGTPQFMAPLTSVHFPHVPTSSSSLRHPTPIGPPRASSSPHLGPISPLGVSSPFPGNASPSFGAIPAKASPIFGPPISMGASVSPISPLSQMNTSNVRPPPSSASFQAVSRPTGYMQPPQSPLGTSVASVPFSSGVPPSLQSTHPRMNHPNSQGGPPSGLLPPNLTNFKPPVSVGPPPTSKHSSSSSSLSGNINSPYVTQQQPLPQNNVQQVSRQLGGLSVTKDGWNRGWGTATCDLLQQKCVVPPYGVEPLRPVLAQDYLPNCSPDIFRCTLTKIPETQSILHKSRLPFGILIHPFKDLEHLAVVSCNTIVRCRSCRTYINPFVVFKGDRRWECNLCFRVNEIPDEFLFDPGIEGEEHPVFSGQGFDFNTQSPFIASDFCTHRHDSVSSISSWTEWSQFSELSRTYGDPSRRPEVREATIEFIAPQEYMLRPPQPAAYVYVLDVSRQAIETGYLKIVCETLLAYIDKIPGDRRTMIGFITFSATIQFYLMGEGQKNVQMLEVGEINDMFIPSPEDLLANLEESRGLVEDLLESLPETHANTTYTQTALGAALTAAYKLISPIGGRITVMSVTLPTLGPGALKPREDPNQRSAKDISHLGPATDFYKKLALDCSGQQVAVDLFTFNSQYIDMATLSGMSKFSGGCIYHFPGFHSERNSPSVLPFRSCFVRYLTRKIGFEAVMRIRATRGLAITNFHGNFFVRSTDLLSLPNINPDAGFGMQVSLEESLHNIRQACFQAALLYTSSKGERRIRVHTLCLPVTPNIHEVINGGDQQAIVGLLAKMAVDKCSTAQMSDAREALVNACCDILSAYKLSLSVYSGLPAPPNLQMMPLYVLALLKSVALRHGMSTKLDDRVFAMCEMKSMPLCHLILTIYPDLYPVHNLSEKGAINIEDMVVPQPERLHLSAEHIDRNGAYLLDAGSIILVYIRGGISSQWVNNVIGVPSFAAIPQPLYEESLPFIDNPVSELARNFVAFLQKNKPFPVPVQIIREDNPSRLLFINYLVDDRSEGAHSYVEFLQFVKSQIK